MILISVTNRLHSCFWADDSKYLYERKTTHLEVPYFVRDNFEREYKGSIRRVEAQVEEDFITNLRASCFRERNYSKSNNCSDSTMLM